MARVTLLTSSFLLLIGCAGIDQKSGTHETTPNALPRVACPATKGDGRDLKMNLAVTPRVGLFNPHQFKVDNDQNKEKRGRGDYMALISPELRPSFPPNWELLLGQEMYKENEARSSGYESRKLTIKVSEGKPSIHDIRCELKLTDPKSGWHEQVNNCAWQGRVGNTRAVLEGEIRYRDGSGAESVVQVRDESVPEDFLLVVIGDSYASGEGNPDRQRSTEIGIDGVSSVQQPAVWMDERCHRSAWAGPLQAGLLLASKTVTEFPASSDRPAIRVSGAYTVVSAACSGATIEQGVIGRYAGRLSMAELARSDSRVRDEPRYYFERMQDLEAQTKQVHKVLDDQDNCGSECRGRPETGRNWPA